MVQNYQNFQNGQIFFFKMVQFGSNSSKLYHKITAVGVTAVGVTAVRNNLKF